MILQFFGLLALIIKIIILSAVYTTLIFLVVFLLSKKVKSIWIENRMKRKFRNWLFLHFLILFALFLFSFSYWQDTGFGDYPKLPIGYGQVIYSPDFAWTDFYPDLNKTEPNKDELQIENFKIQNKKLCAEVSHQNTISPDFDFIVYDLPKQTFETFANEKEYADFASKNNLPLRNEFYSFKEHYNEFLNNKPKWKQWLLP